MGNNIWPYELIFCPLVEEKKCIPPIFFEKIFLMTRIWRKSVFRVWQLSTLVHIQMSVSSLTELHTPCQTLGFSTLSKEQHLFQSITTCVPAHIECYYCNSQYGLEHRVQYSNWFKQRLFLTENTKTQCLTRSMQLY